MYESRRSLHDTHPAGCIVVTPGIALSESMFSIVCKQTAQVKFCPLSLVILLISLSFQAQARLKLNEGLIQKSVFSVLSDGQLVGSGFIIDSKGYALTAAHLVDEEARSVDIVSRALGVTRAAVIGLDRGRDLALVKLKKRDHPYANLQFAKQTLTLAQVVCVAGTVIYRHGLTLCGRIARLAIGYEYFPSLGHYIPVHYVAANTPPGTSGGPWLNASGHIVGMQIGAMQQSTDGAERLSGVSYMVPASQITPLLDARKSILRPTLGIGFEEVWESQHARAQHPDPFMGLVVAHLPANRPAAIPSLQVRDRILKVDSLTLRYRDDLIAWIRSQRVGQRVRVTVKRSDQSIRTHEAILIGI